MSQKAVIGETVQLFFTVFEADGFTPLTGESDGDFTKRLVENGNVSAVSATVAEVGSTGTYQMTFEPDEAGFWRAEVRSDTRNDWFAEELQVSRDISFGASMADDGATATFNLWAQFDGQRVLTMTSMTATVKTGDAVPVASLGTDGTPSADGIFQFTTASTSFDSNVSYYIDISVTDGTSTWLGHAGLAKV